jgi:hypothetical protein
MELELICFAGDNILDVKTEKSPSDKTESGPVVVVDWRVAPAHFVFYRYSSSLSPLSPSFFVLDS